MSQIDSLTSLRFFAAFAIVYAHGGSPAYYFYPFPLIDLRHAVSFFFVLSGFILAYAYEGIDWKKDWSRFALARVARLYPVHLTILAAYVLIFHVYPTRSFTGDGYYLLADVLLIQAWIPIPGLWTSYNGTAWSISAEMAFYIAFPALLWAARRRPLALLIGAALWVTCATLLANRFQIGLTGEPNAWDLVYAWPVVRVAEFAAGIASYRMTARVTPMMPNSKWGATSAELLAIALMLLVMYACTRVTDPGVSILSPSAEVWVRTAGSAPATCVLLVVFFFQRGHVTQLLCWRPLVWLGGASYALYLIHQPILKFQFRYFADWTKANQQTAYLLYLVAAIGIASILFAFVEIPSRRWIRSLTPSRWAGSWLTKKLYRSARRT